jgi:hypothetical protein
VARRGHSQPVTGTYGDPKTARTMVAEWCEMWMTGYATRRPRTVRQAQVHVSQIKAAFGPMPLSGVRPSAVRSWTAKLKADGMADSYVYALPSRLSQIMSDAVHDGSVRSSDCAPPRPWACGSRTSTSCAASCIRRCRGRGRSSRPRSHGRRCPFRRSWRWSCRPRWPAGGGDYVITDGTGRQTSTWAIERAIRSARPKIPGVPEAFRFHDLRHYLASLLIGSGLDVKVVQHRLRHGSAKTTLDTYGDMWPDSDESARAAVGAVLAARGDSSGTADASQG